MRNALITEFLGDGPQDFRLGYGQFLELQEKTGVGPYALYRRLTSDDWMIGDIYEICRIGLIGAQMKPKDAYVLCQRYVAGMPPLDNVNLARMILIAGLMGAPEEDASSAGSTSARSGDESLKSRDYYGAASVMGFTPQDVDAMSLHQVKAAFDGFAKHHNAQSGAMTEDDKNDLFDLVLEEQRKIDGLE